MTPSPSRAPAATGPVAEVVAIPTQEPAVLATLTSSEIRQQIEVARMFPRSIAHAQQTMRELALVDEETAASCFYVLPRRKDDDENNVIEGPSARFAEILQYAWGHIRVQGRIIDELDRFIVAHGACWDVQQNVIRGAEARRRIWTSERRGRQARRYSDDMIQVTANAAISIACRNAVLATVPQPFWRTIYHECKQVAVGDLKTLASRRATALDFFLKAGVTEARIFAVLDVQGVVDIGLNHLMLLTGIRTALREGNTTLDESFPELRPGQGPVVMPQRSESAPATTTAPPPSVAAPPAPASGPGPVERATNEGSIGTGPDRNAPPWLHVARAEPAPRRAGGFFWRVLLSDGRKGVTVDTALGTRLEQLAASRQELAGATFASKGPDTYINAVEVKG